MRDPGEDVALGAETRGPSPTGGRRLHDLQRDLLLVLSVGALRAVDRAHAAAADRLDDAPWPEPHADERIGRRGIGSGVVDATFDAERVVGRVGRQHRGNLP